MELLCCSACSFKWISYLLTIPKELREKFGIDKRAQMEVSEDGIFIRPPEAEGEAAVKNLSLEEQIALLFEAEATTPKNPRSQRRLRLFKRK